MADETIISEEQAKAQHRALKHPEFWPTLRHFMAFKNPRELTEQDVAWAFEKACSVLMSHAQLVVNMENIIRYHSRQQSSKNKAINLG